jgi:hypothetical protein
MVCHQHGCVPHIVLEQPQKVFPPILSKLQIGHRRQPLLILNVAIRRANSLFRLILSLNIAVIHRVYKQNP